MRVPGIGAPRHVLTAALAALEAQGLQTDAASAIMTSAPLGPSRRHYANAAVIISCLHQPPELLARLQTIEQAFGRRRRGRRWGARPLDLDIVLWSGGSWAQQGLTIPHPAFRARTFVLRPATAIAGRWRDPVTHRTLRQLAARLIVRRPLPR